MLCLLGKRSRFVVLLHFALHADFPFPRLEIRLAIEKRPKASTIPFERALGQNSLCRAESKNMWGRLSLTNQKRRRMASQSSSVPVLESLEPRTLLSAVVVQLSAQQDNTIYNVATGDQANGQGQYIVTSGSSGTALARRGMISFDVAAANIPDGATILDVVLTMNLAQTTGGAAAVGVHRLLKGWGEGFSDAAGNETEGAAAGAMDATWLFSRFDGVTWSNAGGDFGGASASVTTRSTGAYEWAGSGLVDDVQDWLDDPYTNFGWMIKSSELAGNVKSFISRNSSNVALRPKLEITYEEPVVPGIVEGRKWHDKNANGIRESGKVLGLDLQFVDGKNFYNQYGGKEYWYQSQVNNNWYFLSPNGILRQWSGKAKSLSGKTVDRLDSQVWYSPETLLGSPEKADEPWMNGFVFELVNSSGDVVATETSRDIDLNGDGIIQTEAEQGWYRFENVEPGKYTVREVVPDGWVQSASRTSPGAEEVYRLDRKLGLEAGSKTLENFGGKGERWLKGSNGWYYVTPIGDLYKWNGRAVTESIPLSGSWIASPGISYFRDPSLLYAAKNPVLNVNPGSVLTRVDFGNYQPVVITGSSRLSQIPEWIRNSPGFEVLSNPSGSKKDPVYTWKVVLVDTDPDDAPGNSDDPLKAVLQDLDKLGRFTSGKKTIVKSSSGASFKIDLSALDQGKYRILDFYFS